MSSDTHIVFRHCRNHMSAVSGGVVEADQAAPMPLWRASVRMALVSAASLVAAGIIATGLVGCEDVSGIAPTASVRDTPSLGLDAAAPALFRRSAG